MDKVVQKAIAKDKRWRAVYIACGLLIVALTLLMGAFLLYQGSQTVLKAHHSVWEFLFTSDWAPLDKTGMFGEKSGLPFTSLVPWKPACWVCSSACRSRSGQPFS